MLWWIIGYLLIGCVGWGVVIGMVKDGLKVVAEKVGLCFMAAAVLVWPVFALVMVVLVVASFVSHLRRK